MPIATPLRNYLLFAILSDMNHYNVKQIAARQKRRRELKSQLRTMTVKELAIKLGITHQAIYKAIRP